MVADAVHAGNSMANAIGIANLLARSGGTGRGREVVNDHFWLVLFEVHVIANLIADDLGVSWHVHTTVVTFAVIWHKLQVVHGVVHVLHVLQVDHGDGDDNGVHILK